MPHTVHASTLHGVLQRDPTLMGLLRSIRQVVARYAATSIRTIPTYTDHTIDHMDALWAISDQVLTPLEINTFTPAEAFLLAASFYLHDIGMAYAATEEGVNRIKSSDVYKSYIATINIEERDLPETIAAALAVSVRHLHSGAALELATSEIPGSSGYFVFPDKVDRDLWGQTCGLIASSHHWSVAQLDTTFGKQREAALPGGRKGDLLYVSACLRLIDYAHINRDRASSMDRAFRTQLGPESLQHWVAQENIDGPQRDKGDYLSYRAAKLISSVDAWWLFYEMINGLDAEIRAVTRCLDGYSQDYKRITLRGVRGAGSPDEATFYIPTSGFLPIEVNLRTGSIEKLVELLAGETLYGPNPLAAIRELVQNARDAVALKSTIVVNPADRAALTLPIFITLRTDGTNGTLEVVDHGVGMTKLVMTDYLISIASNYWVTQFLKDFPEAANTFRSAGKFGIGFLSVFMLGSEVVVESNRLGEERYKLSLRGVGRRGELQQVRTPGGSGTSIKIKLKAQIIDRLKKLDSFLRIYAPTLPHDLSIEIDGKKTTLEEGWIGKLSCEEIELWATEAARELDVRGNASLKEHELRDYHYVDMDYILSSRLGIRYNGRGGRGESEQYPWKDNWPRFTNQRTILIASFRGVSILSLRGLAVQSIRTPGCSGIIEIDSLETDVSRSRVLNTKLAAGVVSSALEAFAPAITQTLDRMSKGDVITNILEFVSRCARLYGHAVIRNSTLLWISEITLPGNAETIDCSSFLERVSRKRSVFVVFNSGPWTALKQWVESSNNGTPDADEMAIILDDAGTTGPGYMSNEETRIDSLEQLWRDIDQCGLFFTLIRLVAEGWQVSPSELIKQKGWSHKGSTLYGKFTRS
jgi:hypothetical protein